jgi:formate-dependent nitrite reductase cytochrome c552 subunit
MAVNFRSVLPALACISTLGLAALVSAQAPAPTADRPHLAKDAKEAMDFLATWVRVTSGEEYFKGATYVGSEGCKGSGCHDQQIQEWRTTWHSKILTLPSAETVKGNFNNAVIPFQNIRAVAKGHDADLAKLQNVPVKFDVRTESSNGKFFFIIVDPRDTGSPKSGQKYEVALVVGGKWQQTYHVRPVGSDGNPGDFYFPAPIRWSLNPNPSPGQPTGAWEIGNFQPENWIWFDNSELAIPRKPDELPVARFAEGKCMGCHTTGFDFVPPDPPPANQHWKMQGAGEMAVGCERCHGPGSKHVELAKQKEAAGSKLNPDRDPPLIIHGLRDLSLDQQNQVCGQCHARLGGKALPILAFPDVFDHKHFLPGDSNLTERARIWSYIFPPTTTPGNPPSTTIGQGFDNFWPDGRGKKSRTQWQDHVGGPHGWKAGASCMTCHAFHGDAVSKDPQQQSKLRQPPKELCESCHSQSGTTKQPNREMYAGGPSLASSQHADQGVECVDCHMGAVGQRMTATTAGKAAFDVSFHGMWIAYSGNPPATLSDARGNCEVCHTDRRIMTNGTEPPPKTAAQLLDYVRKIQESTKAAITKIQNRAGTNKSKDSKTILQLNNAQANLNTILMDGSMGVHNSRVTPNGTVSPQGGIADCLRLANIWVELACRQPAANCTGATFNPIRGQVAEPNPPVCLTPTN